MTTLFVSDLHLDASEPASGAQFRQFLLGSARDAEALYILGDLFETWIGDDDDESYRAGICAALAGLTVAGVPCYVMHGNRDFLLGRGFEQRTGAFLIGDPLIVELQGEPVLLTHGDALCTADHAYQRLRALVRSPRWQRRFLALPLSVRRALAARARSGSRKHMARIGEDITDVDDESVLAAMRACGVRSLVHGHTHRPAVHALTLDGERAQRIVLGAWHEAGSCLAWDARGPQLLRLTREAAA
ncbi:MAG TPA: UDP-2,3-diacylglucosamine diphosphatase [Steroidobacteraceae bacterium]|nr:UDP-2,3-diacylglucosamine diphosphatase [Steroidobacteraceae bacterium]